MRGGEHRSLNALDWMEYGVVVATDGRVITFAGDRQAIDWLNQHVAGSPVIAEAVVIDMEHRAYRGAYRCNGSRIAVATGLPTVMGWDRHESQQRHTDEFMQRRDDIRDLYTSTDIATKEAVINRYRIEYIIVGPLEIIYPEIRGNACVPTGSQAGIDAFQTMIGATIEPVFSADGTTIYQVIT